MDEHCGHIYISGKENMRSFVISTDCFLEMIKFDSHTEASGGWMALKHDLFISLSYIYKNNHIMDAFGFVGEITPVNE